MCSACGVYKPATDFCKHRRALDGLNQKCKMCCKARDAVFKKAHPERYQEMKATWRAKNPGKVKLSKEKSRAANPDRVKAIEAAARARWVIKNPEKRLESNAAWALANPEKVAEAKTAWRAANPERLRLYSHNRRARLRTVGGKLSVGLAAKLFRLQRGKCACCRDDLGIDFHLDHITPLARGGANADNNIQLLCRTCNLRKGAKHPIDFMRQFGNLI